MHPIFNVAASFAAGAAAMYWLDSAVSRRRTGGQVLIQARLREQVQACIGRLVSHPDAIQVSVEDGMVRVSGHVLASEQDRLLSQLTQLPGVHKVRNALSAVQDPGRFDQQRAAQLQGEFGAGAA